MSALQLAELALAITVIVVSVAGVAYIIYEEM